MVIMGFIGIVCMRLEDPRKGELPGTNVETQWHDKCVACFGKASPPSTQPHLIYLLQVTAHTLWLGGDMTQD